MVRHRWTMALVFCLMVLVVPVEAKKPAFQVVVNAANPETSITKEELSSLFLKQTEKWSDGVEVEAVDLDPKSKIRQEFSRQIHDREVTAIKSFWQQQIFSGRGIPPMESTSEIDVMMFVQSAPGGIGYVSVGVELGEGVKVLQLTE